MAPVAEPRDNLPASLKRTAVGRDRLAEAVYRSKRSLSREEARELVDQCLEEIQAGLRRDGLVKLHGFGVFAVADKSERIGRNPRTGEEFPIRSRKTLRFRPSPIMLESIRADASCGPSSEQA